MSSPFPSPYQTYVDFCRQGLLAYQIDETTGTVVFHPRVAAPGTGSTRLAWKTSRGVGTVHATTTVFERGVPSHNVCLVQLDEGYRMMSRVEDVAPLDVAIGLRVRVRFTPETNDQPPYPVFVPLEDPL